MTARAPSCRPFASFTPDKAATLLPNKRKIQLLHLKGFAILGCEKDVHVEKYLPWDLADVGLGPGVGSKGKRCLLRPHADPEDEAQGMVTWCCTRLKNVCCDSPQAGIYVCYRRYSDWSGWHIFCQHVGGVCCRMNSIVGGTCKAKRRLEWRDSFSPSKRMLSFDYY